MNEEFMKCHFLYESVMDFSSPFATPKFKSILRKPFRFLNTIMKSKRSSKNASTTNENIPIAQLNLVPGELVQVRSLEEILSTLDEKNKLRGLLFMPEMKKFCGKNFRVFKRVERIMLESTGEFRKLRTTSIFLEGSYCDGAFHENCDRSCFCFWREEWLKRIPE